MTVAAAIAAHEAFTLKLAAANDAISALYAERDIFNHMIDHDSDTVYISTDADYINCWTSGYTKDTTARVKRITAAFANVGLRHQSTGYERRGVRLAFRVA